MKSPTYTAICHTLCGVDSNSKWVKTKACTYNEMLRVDVNKTAKVWQNFLQARLMLVEHNCAFTRARVFLIYFLMTGRPVNVWEIMLGEMARTRFGCKVKRFFFRKSLTQYMLSLDVLEYPEYYELEDALKGVLDITTILDIITKLSTASRVERDEKFSRYLCGSLNLIIRWLGVSDEEKR